jgi:D-alanyl-D-alanine carboxypeptidase
LIDSRAYGKADLELDVKTEVGDKFEIGSISKQFTAFGALLLMDEGKLSLDDPVSKYIPEAPASWSKVTLRHMLYQISGLPEYALVKGIGLVDEFDRKKFLEEITKLPLDFEPGVAWAYSNTNYALMGWVIENVSGKPYTTFMTERVFKPLGMTETTFSNPYEIIPRRARGYLADQGRVLRSKYSSASINSDGTIISNVADMAKWDEALLQRKLLKPSTYDLMWSGGKLNSGRTRPYGTGWNLTAFGARPYVGHAGNSAGYSAGFARYLEPKLSVVVLCNLYPISGEGLARQIAENLDPSLKYKAPNGLNDPNSARTEKVKSALLKLAEGSPDESLLETEVTAPMKTSRAKMFGPGAMAALKTMTSMAFAGETPEGKDTWVSYLVITPTRDFVVSVLYTEKGKVAQTILRPTGPVKKQPYN